MEMKKPLVIGIIFLFLGVAVAPGINFTVVKASNNNDLVEVTSQACGIQGFGNTTVKLTREQYQNLEQYLVDFRARLNQTTTREEAVPIFKDAVAELNKYGLLPKGMSVERAQRLVTMGEHIENMIKNMKKFKPSSTNAFCLFTGLFQGSIELNIFTILGFILFYFGNYWNPGPLLLGFVLLGIGYFKPLRFMNVVMDITDVILFFSIGVNGIVRGKQYFDMVIGFTGLKIVLDSQDGYSFYLGFALGID
jgi:hypothetical protein